MMKESISSASIFKDTRTFHKKSPNELVPSHLKYKVEANGRKIKKNRFPFEVFSAGSAIAKKAVAILPDDSRIRKHSMEGERPHMRRTESIPDFRGKEELLAKLEENRVNNLEMLAGRNHDSFLPKIRGITNKEEGSTFLTVAPGMKRKSIYDTSLTPSNTTSVSRTPILPEHAALSTEQGSVKKENWSESQTTNLDLLLSHSKRNTGILDSNRKKCPVTELENLQLPISNIDKIWKTLHTRLKPIQHQPNVKAEDISAIEEILRKTAYFKENAAIDAPNQPIKALKPRKQAAANVTETIKQESTKTVNVTFGAHDDT